MSAETPAVPIVSANDPLDGLLLQLAVLQPVQHGRVRAWAGKLLEHGEAATGEPPPAGERCKTCANKGYLTVSEESSVSKQADAGTNVARRSSTDN
jgi:hypothetical protein